MKGFSQENLRFLNLFCVWKRINQVGLNKQNYLENKKTFTIFIGRLFLWLGQPGRLSFDQCFTFRTFDLSRFDLFGHPQLPEVLVKRRPLEDDVFVVDVVGRHRRFQTATFRKTFGSLSRVIQVNWIDTLSTQTLFSSIHDYLARRGPDEIIVGMSAEKRKERKRIKSDCFFSYLINNRFKIWRDKRVCWST